jgi:hypothetical protein
VTTSGFKVNVEKKPQPGENEWCFLGKLGQDPKVFYGKSGMMCFINLFRPHAGKGTMVPMACFGEIAGKVIAGYKAGDWAKCEGYFYSYRDKKTGMLKSQQVVASIQHEKIDEASFRAKEAASLEESGDPARGLFE